MKRYIKTNNENFITDIFHEHQKEKFDGSEIFLDEVEKQSVWIDGKVIFDETNNPIFKLISNKPILQPENILYTEYKQKKIDNKKLQDAKDYLFETDHKIIKQIELGEACPPDVLNKRQAARATISEIEGTDKKKLK